MREEASWLDTVYSTMLYGGPSLEDGAADGAHDTNTGSLFARQKHADMLFGAKGCMRDQQGTCFGASDPFYQVRNEGRSTSTWNEWTSAYLQRQALPAHDVHPVPRYARSGCVYLSTTSLAPPSMHVQVSRHAIDPMVRRLMREATLMGLDALEDVNHTSSR